MVVYLDPIYAIFIEGSKFKVTDGKLLFLAESERVKRGNDFRQRVGKADLKRKLNK